MHLEINNNTFVLLAQKAIYWKDQHTLLVSDVHLGKVTHFRKEGIAIPASATYDNFMRLTELIAGVAPRRIIFLGDLFHSRYNAEWEMFASWRRQHAHVAMLIILGNHDILPLHLFTASDIAVYEKEFVSEGFLFTHQPAEHFGHGMHVFCGHIHPVFSLRARARQHLRLPCFVNDMRQTILPSFGVFTGGYEMDRADGRNFYGIVEKSIVHMNPQTVS